jgi:FPC/CPF motif-containing protein YcgG
MNVRSALALYGSRNPFNTSAALRGSNYSAFVAGRLVRVLDFRPTTPRARLAHSALRQFILSDAYPCVGARSVVNRSTYRFGYYGPLSSGEMTQGLARDLCAFVAERKALNPQFSSFMAAFEDEGLDEGAFEAELWSLLARLRAADERFHPYASSVSPGTDSPDYAFSFAQEALFVVGMHPQASRLARRFAYPMIVFNPHDQFVTLRDTGGWEKFQATIRNRELALQGSLNPNLAEHGSISEARQYSGKSVDDTWQCPFNRA